MRHPLHQQEVERCHQPAPLVVKKSDGRFNQSPSKFFCLSMSSSQMDVKSISRKRVPGHKDLAAAKKKRHHTYEGSHGWSKDGATLDHKRHPCSNKHGHVACQPPKRIRQVLLRETDLIYAHVWTKQNKTQQHLHLLYTTVIMQRASGAACQGFVWAIFFPPLQAVSPIFNNNVFVFMAFLCAVQMVQPLGRVPTCVDDLMDDLCDVAFKERVEEFD